MANDDTSNINNIAFELLIRPLRNNYVMEEKIKNFFDKNKEIISEIAGLTTHILEEDLKEALSIQKGYFKNKKGEYLFVKGIEVTNDTGNLLRMGFNGEDRGVWVHYVSLTKDSIIYNDIPIAAFINQTNPRLNKPDVLMVPTTKEDFEEQLTKTVKNIISDYQEKRDIREYLNVFDEWDQLMNSK